MAKSHSPRERRLIAARVEVRSDDETGEVRFAGYASSTDSPYQVGGDAGWSETIASGAFRKTLMENADVRLLINHEGVPLARTSSGTLTLEEDAIGLRCEATLDAGSPTVQALTSALERGDIDEMSIGFYAVRNEWNDDYTERTIREVELFDVSVVTYPANPATMATVQRDAVQLDEHRARKSARMSLDLARGIASTARRRR